MSRRRVAGLYVEREIAGIERVTCTAPSRRDERARARNARREWGGTVAVLIRPKRPHSLGNGNISLGTIIMKGVGLVQSSQCTVSQDPYCCRNAHSILVFAFHNNTSNNNSGHAVLMMLPTSRNTACPRPQCTCCAVFETII